MWDCNQATLDSSLSNPKNILKRLPSTFNSSTEKQATLETGGWFVIASSSCYLCEVWDLDVLHSITTKPCRIRGSVLDQPFCSDCACSFMGSSAWSQLRQESVPFLCISPVPAHSCTAHPLAEVCQVPAPAANWISHSTKPVRLSDHSLNLFLCGSSEHHRSLRQSSGAGGDGREGERHKHLHTGSSVTCGATPFVTPALLWSSALLSHLAVPAPPCQPKGKQQTQRKLFSLGWRARKDTGLEAEVYLEATYGSIIIFPNTLSSSLGSKFWYSRAGQKQKMSSCCFSQYVSACEYTNQFHFK